jgi:hypothetical protein
MSIVKFKQIAAGRRGGAKDAADRSYSVVWIAIVDSAYDGPLTIGNYRPGGDPSGNVPLRFQPYVGYENTSDPDALCRDVQVEQDGEEWKKWRVTATFSPNISGPSASENPEEDPVSSWIETNFEVVEVTKSWDGKEILNTAGQLVAGARRKIARETWVWEKNYLTLNRGLWKSYQNSVNSDDFYEAEPGHGLLHIIVPKAQFRGGVQFFRVQFRVEINDDDEKGWNADIANRGTMVKNSDGDLEVPMDPRTGQKISEEVWLDSAGRYHPDGTIVPYIYIENRPRYRPMPFGALGFDS